MHPIASAPLSPSRVSSFKNCELAFRYRYIDGLPERPSAAALRGNLVHSCLEHLFAQPRAERSLEGAVGQLDSALDSLLAQAPERVVAIDAAMAWPYDSSEAPTPESLQVFKAEAAALIQRYFDLEDPATVDVVELERYARAELAEGPTVHGYIDRLERNAESELVVTDYKTGKAPGERFRDKAWSQLLTYALLLRQAGEQVAELRLHYLGGPAPQTLRFRPSSDDLDSLEHDLRHTARQLQRKAETGDFRAKESPLCNYCDFQEHCPAKGGQALPWPPAG